MAGPFPALPLKTGSFEAGVFGYVFLDGKGAESHEGIEVHGGAKGIHPEAGQGRNAGGGDLSGLKRKAIDPVDQS
jgi:hypothetical protein